MEKVTCSNFECVVLNEGAVILGRQVCFCHEIHELILLWFGAS